MVCYIIHEKRREITPGKHPELLLVDANAETALINKEIKNNIDPLQDAVVKWLEELKIRAYGSEFVFPNRRASKRFGHVSSDTLNAAIGKLFRESKL